MGTSDPNYKRYGILLIIVVFMLFLFACKSILLHDTEEYESFTSNIVTEAEAKQDMSILDAISTVFGFFGFLVGLFFFEMPNIAWYLNIFLVPIYVILLFTFWYMVADIVYQVYQDTWIG